MLAVSSRLGPYEIVALLGAGGMGEVYRARDSRLEREVAVKVLPELFANDPVRRARFEREARAVAALSHPNILAIHDYGTQGTMAYAVMELLEGETLRGRLARGPLSWREAVQVGAAILEGLAAAHAKGIVHRDLKPENLFLTADGRVKILDFGLARVAPPSGWQSETAAYIPAETVAGTVMGTVGYMSPEQVRGQSADTRSDVFSFGCVLYEMVTGRRAFRCDTVVETMTAILHDEPANLLDSGIRVPAELGRIIHQCLAKNPNQRFQSARDLVGGLQATVSQGDLDGKVLTRASSRLLVPVLAAVMVIALSATTVYFATRGRSVYGPGQAISPAHAIEAVAVLPFVYNGDDSATEMLSETLAGHIIDSLGQVQRSGLQIRPFSSVARYARQRLDTPAVGRALNVPLIVTGTIQQQGMELTITVEVIEARQDNLIWSNRYSCQAGGDLDLNAQDRMVQDVAVNLGLQLTGEERRRLTRRRTANPEAYNLYREAMYHLGKFTPAGLAAAIGSCQRAIDIDPNYALPHAVLARCYILRGSLYEGPKKTYSQGRASLAEALRLDPKLAEAHSALAVIHLFHDWDWSAAEREIDLALALDPNTPLTLPFQGFVLAMQNRLPEALTSIRRGQELDPLSPGRRNELAMCYNWMRDYDQAIVEAKKSLELEPSFPLAHAELGLAYVGKGMHDESIALLLQALDRGQQQPRAQGMLGYAYAASGRTLEAQQVLDELKRNSQGRFGFALSIARIHAALRQQEQAFEWLKQALDEREPGVVWLKHDSSFDALRSDSRFTDVLNEIGLPL